MIRLSIVIPCWHDASLLEKTLLSVLQNRPAQCEILVVHPGIYEDPYDLSDEVRFLEASRDREIVSVINETIEQAQGEVIHVLHAGVDVEEGWTDNAVARFQDAAVGSVIPLVLDAQRPTHLISAGMRMTFGGSPRDCGRGRRARPQTLKRQLPAGPATQAGFFRSTALQAVGMFAPQVGYPLVGLDVGLSMTNIGYRVELESTSKVYAVESDLGDVQSPFDAGRRAERMVWRNSVARPWWKTWLSRLPIVAVEAIASVVRPKQIAKPFGRMLAWAEGTKFRRHHRCLLTAIESTPPENPSLPSHVRIHAAHGQTRSADASVAQRAKAG